MEIGKRVFMKKSLRSENLSIEPFLFIEEICEKGIVVMGGSREEKEFVLNGEFTTSPTKLNTNKPLYKKGSKREMEREYAKFLNKIY